MPSMYLITHSLAVVLLLVGAGPGSPAGKQSPGIVEASLLRPFRSIHSGQEFEVGIKFHISDEWHIYWRNPGDSGLAPSIDWRLPDGFEAGRVRFPTPRRYTDRAGLVTNILEGQPVLLCRLKAPDSLTPGQTVEIAADLRWLACKESCIMEDAKVSLTLDVVSSGTSLEKADSEELEYAKELLPYEGGKSEFVTLSARSSVAKLAPGTKSELILTVNVKSGHHIQSNQPFSEFFIPTQVFLDRVKGVTFGKPIFPKPRIRQDRTLGKLSEFVGQVEIQIPVEPGDDLDAHEVTAGGIFVYQACEDRTGRCYPREAVEWSATVPIGVEPPASAGGFDIDATLEIEDTSKQWAWWMYLLAALFGGLILNVMPCVLPVLSIKVLSFVQQAGEDPRRILHLNLAFSAGLILVFEVLATLAVLLELGWGGLFGNVVFDVVMAALVFAFGLSLFGVYEIPIPGFVAKAGVSGAVEKEGLAGAFLKGVFATLLATPCSGPFLGATFAWSVRQPVLVTYVVWGTIGLGMALPYLILGLKPGWMSFLPKPGAWMETFKQAMGFLLMGTAVYFLYVLPDVYAVWTAAFLLFVGLACWMYGRFNTPSVSFGRGMVINVLAVGLIVLGAWLNFGKLLPIAETRAQLVVDARAQALAEERVSQAGTLPGASSSEHRGSELPWQPFSLAKLEKETAAGRTVLVDFTADWCPNCKANEALALNTSGTKALVEEFGVVCLLADYTRRPPEITRMLKKLDSISIPLTAIFPARRPNAPIVLRDTYLEGTLHEKLRQAGPSRGFDRAVSDIS